MNKIDELVYEFIKEKALFENCSGVVLAVSGGPDSMAMLNFFINNRKLFPFSLFCCMFLMP
jgi:tRNA(Ile)-lysidine synthase TilS/MesJ